MASNFSDAEARAIIERSRELLDDAATDRPSNPPVPTEMTLEEILQEALAQPVESYVDKSRRELRERDERWAERRRQRETVESDALSSLETRLNDRIASQGAEQREVALALIDDVFALFTEEVTIPLEREVDAMLVRLATLEAQIKKLELDRGVEPVNLPNPLAARRVQ